MTVATNTIFPFFEVTAKRGEQEVWSDSATTLDAANDIAMIMRNEHDTLLNQKRRGYDYIEINEVLSDELNRLVECIEL